MQASDKLPVSRTKEEARQFYDRISSVYDYLTGSFERKYAERAVENLSIKQNGMVLEIGFGTGHCLKRIAEGIGKKGKVHGIDISHGMLEITKSRLEKAGFEDRTELSYGDAMNLPYTNSVFDVVFASFTLELFETHEIPKVLFECKRVLKLRGKLGIVSMSKEDGNSLLLRLYEWTHRKWPKYLDCKPIYVEQFLKKAGYTIRSKEKVGLFGFPIEIIVALKI